MDWSFHNYGFLGGNLFKIKCYVNTQLNNNKFVTKQSMMIHLYIYKCVCVCACLKMFYVIFGFMSIIHNRILYLHNLSEKSETSRTDV